MSLLAHIIAGRDQIIDHRPWPRILVDTSMWRYAADRLADGSLALLSEWGEPGWVHMAVLGSAAPPVAVLSLACPGNRFPAISAVHPPAIRLGRPIRDLFGLVPGGLAGTPPRRGHGRWGRTPEPPPSH